MAHYAAGIETLMCLGVSGSRLRCATGLAFISLLLVMGLAAVVTPVSALPSEFKKSMTFFTTTTNGYQSERAAQSLANLVAVGAKEIVVQVSWYMDTGMSTSIYFDPRMSPSDESVSYFVQKIKDLGLKPSLKINVDTKDGTLRKKISPTDWRVWWQSYRGFVLHYARLAESSGVEVFLIGTEFDSAVLNVDSALWRQLIRDIRALYSGKVTYGASRISCIPGRVPACVPGYREVTWWDALDYAGIDAWFPLTNINNPTLAQLLDAWKPYVQDIEDWQLYIGKPVFFTEMGYSSYDGTNKAPFKAWEGEPLDFQEQVATYEAAFQTFFDKAWLHGIFWWYWAVDPDAGGMSNGKWPVQNKPAQQTVATWYAKTWPIRQTSFTPQPGLTTTLMQPKDGAQVSSSNGLTLRARVTDNLTPASSVKVTFYVGDLAAGVGYADGQGYAVLLCSPLTGTYSWHAKAEKPGYRAGVSETRAFQYTATLRENLLSPKDGVTVASPVTLKVRIVYAGIGVPSATVTFYVDGNVAGTVTTDSDGYAKISASLGAGGHKWYATASGTGYATSSSSTRSFKVA